MTGVHRDGDHLTLAGVVHFLHISPNSSRWPLSLGVEDPGQTGIALLTQEHIDALAAYLEDYRTPPGLKNPCRCLSDEPWHERADEDVCLYVE